MGNKRGGGRSARVAMRQAPVAPVNPAPNGPVGGQYRPLDDGQVREVLDSAYRILDEIGMGEVPAVLMDAALGAGARKNDLGRLSFSRDFVEDIIEGACKSFAFHGRDPRDDIEVGGDRVYFGTGGAAVQTLDMDSGLYRPSTLRDLYDFTRIVDQLDTMSWFTRCCIATDVPDPYDLDINTAYALLKGTTKPIGMSFTLGEYVAPIVEMFDMALGGAGRFKDRPFCKAHISPIISPLRYGEDAVDVTIAAIPHNMPLNVIVAAQSGATGPATPAGMLAMSTAETLAALIMVNIFAPGHPTIFSNWPFVVDLRTGAFAGSGAETAMMNAAIAQIGNHLGLPTGVASSMADAKAVDAQMGAEKALSAVTTGLSGANMIYESAGMMASLLGASFEAFVLDDEMLTIVNRMIRGIEVNEETLGVEAVRDVVLGDGHFLGSAQTMAAMERDYVYPKLADRASPTVWAEMGARAASDVAREKARELLAGPDPMYLDAATDGAIRAKYEIFLNTMPKERSA